MGDYVRELNIELKKLEKEIAETREPMNPEESLEEWERSYNKRKEEIERRVDECFERFDERKRREEQEREEQKKTFIQNSNVSFKNFSFFINYRFWYDGRNLLSYSYFGNFFGFR